MATSATARMHARLRVAPTCRPRPLNHATSPTPTIPRVAVRQRGADLLRGGRPGAERPTYQLPLMTEVTRKSSAVVLTQLSPLRTSDTALKTPFALPWRTPMLATVWNVNGWPFTLPDPPVERPHAALAMVPEAQAVPPPTVHLPVMVKA